MRRRHAFTLLEVLVALALLAIGLVGVMESVSQSLRQTKANADRAEAGTLAQQRLTELTLTTDLAPGTDEGEFGDEHPGFRWRSSVESTEHDGLYRLSVTVLWTPPSGEQSLELQTCLAPGLLTSGPLAGGTSGGDQATASDEAAGTPASPSSNSLSPSPSSPSSLAALSGSTRRRRTR